MVGHLGQVYKENQTEPETEISKKNYIFFCSDAGAKSNADTIGILLER